MSITETIYFISEIEKNHPIRARAKKYTSRNAAQQSDESKCTSRATDIVVIITNI